MESEVEGARTRLKTQIDSTEADQRAADTAAATDMSIEKRRLEVAAAAAPRNCGT